MRSFNFKETKFYKMLYKDIKEFNTILLSLFCISFLVLVGVISYKVNSSYALFTDKIDGKEIIELSASNCKGNRISSDDTSGANEPVLSENMIPVYYDECDEVWKKADKSNNNMLYKWYNYDEKIWANSVTVTEEKREEYKNAKMGTEISMDDILTMQVWIPRYKYTVWNYNSDGTVTSEPQEINIEFERGTVTSGEIECSDVANMGTSDGTPEGTKASVSEECFIKLYNRSCTDTGCNEKTYTHPAFTFGDKELTGFWVGKFEVSSDISCSPVAYAAIGERCNIDTIRPLVKPNVKSWRGAMISIFENNMMAMNDANNKYGFATTDDTHMMKNMEWGAVAYLSHSKYGTCTNGECSEININNSRSYYTGRSGGSTTASSSAEGTYKYNETKIETTVLTGGTNITPSVTNDTTYPWSESDGLYKSSNQGVDSSSSEIVFNFVAPSDNTYLSFEYSVSSQVNDYVAYVLTKDGINLSPAPADNRIEGINIVPTENNLIYFDVKRQLQAGNYTLKFYYTKDSSTSSGLDTGYIRNVKIVDNPEVGVRNLPIGKGEDGPSASTTGNIYGIYDMSGGTREYVMGNIVSPNGTAMMSGERSVTEFPNYHSGYSGILYYDGDTSAGYASYTGIYSYPDDKYYDKYIFDTSSTRRRKSKLGDAIKEVYNTSNYGWYGDYSYLAYSSAPWIDRGSNHSDGSKGGVFYSHYYYGYASGDRSSRLVISQ